MIFSLICWITLLIVDIIVCAQGGTPTWFQVFVPLVCLIVVIASDIFIKKLEEKEKKQQDFLNMIEDLKDIINGKDNNWRPRF